MQAAAKKLRKVRSAIMSGDMRVYGQDQDGWPHFAERTIMRLNESIGMYDELERLVNCVENPPDASCENRDRGAIA